MLGNRYIVADIMEQQDALEKNRDVTGWELPGLSYRTIIFIGNIPKQMEWCRQTDRPNERKFIFCKYQGVVKSSIYGKQLGKSLGPGG